MFIVYLRIPGNLKLTPRPKLPEAHTRLLETHTVPEACSYYRHDPVDSGLWHDAKFK